MKATLIRLMAFFLSLFIFIEMSLLGAEYRHSELVNLLAVMLVMFLVDRWVCRYME